jgi:hypothetical protein
MQKEIMLILEDWRKIQEEKKFKYSQMEKIKDYENYRV